VKERSISETLRSFFHSFTLSSFYLALLSTLGILPELIGSIRLDMENHGTGQLSTLQRVQAFMPELKRANEALGSDGAGAQCDAEVVVGEEKEEDENESSEPGAGAASGSGSSVLMDLSLGVFDVKEESAADALESECDGGPASVPVTQPDLLRSGHLQLPGETSSNERTSRPLIQEQHSASEPASSHQSHR
jgi:hypothetical protein